MQHRIRTQQCCDIDCLAAFDNAVLPTHNGNNVVHLCASCDSFRSETPQLNRRSKDEKRSLNYPIDALFSSGSTTAKMRRKLARLSTQNGHSHPTAAGTRSQKCTRRLKKLRIHLSELNAEIRSITALS